MLIYESRGIAAHRRPVVSDLLSLIDASAWRCFREDMGMHRAPERLAVAQLASLLPGRREVGQRYPSCSARRR